VLRFFARAFAGACCALSAAAQVLPAPPSIAARAWVVIDAQSGQELAGHAQDEEIVPASLAKLMTAYLTFAALRAERLRWDEAVVISTRAASAPAPKLFLSGAVPQNAADLLRGLLIAGANDAAIALAERVGGNEAEFVAAMNREAHRLGLSHTRYVNPSGLPQTGQVSSVGDAARLAMALTRFRPPLVLRQCHWGFARRSRARYRRARRPAFTRVADRRLPVGARWPARVLAAGLLSESQ
jgi:D-alanyl-D-alanine carboxypeptidase (penicillin-binding protein 5/6)